MFFVTCAGKTSSNKRLGNTDLIVINFACLSLLIYIQKQVSNHNWEITNDANMDIIFCVIDEEYFFDVCVFTELIWNTQAWASNV